MPNIGASQAITRRIRAGRACLDAHIVHCESARQKKMQEGLPERHPLWVPLLFFCFVMVSGYTMRAFMRATQSEKTRKSYKLLPSTTTALHDGDWVPVGRSVHAEYG